LDFVAKFIDRLDSIDVSKKEIEEFRKKSKSVESTTCAHMSACAVKILSEQDNDKLSAYARIMRKNSASLYYYSQNLFYVAVFA
jgi:hypothetical protein